VNQLNSQLLINHELNQQSVVIEKGTSGLLSSFQTAIDDINYGIRNGDSSYVNLVFV